MKRWGAWLLVLLLCLGVWLPRSARADLGDFSGGGDYGDSDWGSDSGWDDDDWDDDYDSPGGFYVFPGGGGSSSSGGGGNFLVYVIIVVIVLVVLSRMKKKGQPAASAGKAAGASRTDQSRLMPMSEYAAIDPEFSEGAMVQKLSNLYVQMQNCCTARDIEPLRPYFADALYQQFDRQMQGLKSSRRINKVERIAVLDVKLRGFYQQEGEDHLVAELKTRITDYTISEDTGAILSGSDKAEKFMTYEWQLSRPTGTKTEGEAEVTNRHCPNCGAPLSVNQSARCPYCDSVITFKDHDWTIYAIKGIAQKTVG